MKNGDLLSPVVNQHFLSQVEQRQHSINPDAKNSNQRIYRFSILDRVKPSLKLDGQNGVPIKSTMSINDLFSFDVNDGSRRNFESLFSRYENDVKEHTESLLEKLSEGNGNIKDELVELFAAKLFNYLRNPYCIHGVLHSFSDLRNIIPVNNVDLKWFQAISKGNKPHQEYLCSQLGVSSDEYEQWLQRVYLLLKALDGEELNFFDRYIVAMIDDKETVLGASIYTYDNDVCLLSDRSFWAIEDKNGANFFFNLTSHSFIEFNFINIDAILNATSSAEVSRDNINPHDLVFYHEKNDFKMLERYNAMAINQCHKNVYGSSVSIYGVDVT